MIQQELLMRATITKIDAAGPYCEVPALGEDYEVGPLESLPFPYVVGTKVLVAAVETTEDDVVVVGPLYDRASDVPASIKYFDSHPTALPATGKSGEHFYITSTSMLYKYSGGWQPVGLLRGPQGEPGQPGAASTVAGPTGPQGPPGTFDGNLAVNPSFERYNASSIPDGWDFFWSSGPTQYNVTDTFANDGLRSLYMGLTGGSTSTYQRMQTSVFRITPFVPIYVEFWYKTGSTVGATLDVVFYGGAGMDTGVLGGNNRESTFAMNTTNIAASAGAWQKFNTWVIPTNAESTYGRLSFSLTTPDGAAKAIYIDSVLIRPNPIVPNMLTPVESLPLSYLGAWSDYGTGWDPLQVNHDPVTKMTWLSGLVYRTTNLTMAANTAALIATLPAKYRPAKQHMFNPHCRIGSATAYRLDVLPDGSIQQSTTSAQTWSSGTGQFASMETSVWRAGA